MSAIYPFEVVQEPESRIAEYTFTIRFNIGYSVSFTDVTTIIDIFDNYPSLSNGVYLIVEPVNPPATIQFDSSTGKTVSAIFEHYINNTDLNSVVIFNCDERDGKQLKRYNKFDR